MSILTESSTKRLSLEKFQRICTKRLRLCQQIAGGNTPVESIDRFHRDGKTDRMAVVAGQSAGPTSELGRLVRNHYTAIPLKTCRSAKS